MTNYELPRVWSAADSNQGKFSGINRPTAGSRFKKVLPKGEKPFQLYSLGTPNGVKVTILLEELLALGIKEADYDLYKISIMDGEQFGTGFVEVIQTQKFLLY